MDRDENVQRLYVILNNVYDFLTEAKHLEKIQTHKSVFVRMTQQTIDCGYFIASYAKNKSFCMYARHISKFNF
jgi:hypothetical protein